MVTVLVFSLMFRLYMASLFRSFLFISQCSSCAEIYLLLIIYLPLGKKTMTSSQKVENDTQMMNDWLNSIQTLQKSVDPNYIQSCSISIISEELKNSSNELKMLTCQEWYQPDQDSKEAKKMETAVFFYTVLVLLCIIGVVGSKLYGYNCFK
jgi:hypothetical protein